MVEGGESRMRCSPLYWEDVKIARERKYGPLVFSSKLLDTLLEMMGEKHPIHDDAAFAMSASRRQRIVPGGFIHSITSGWTVKSGGSTAVIGLRSTHWDFIRPLYPDVPFYFTNTTVDAHEIDERRGLVSTVRRVFDEPGKLIALGRMSAVIMRRPLSTTTC
mgnify:CR=1 FL=1